MLNLVPEASAFGTDAGSQAGAYVICRLHLGLSMTDCCSPATSGRLCHGFSSRKFAVALCPRSCNRLDSIQIWAIRRPQIWRKSVTILNFRISQDSVVTYCRWGVNICHVYTIFLYKSIGERTLKIDLHLPKLLGYLTSGGLLVWDVVYVVCMRRWWLCRPLLCSVRLSDTAHCRRLLVPTRRRQSRRRL